MANTPAYAVKEADNEDGWFDTDEEPVGLWKSSPYYGTDFFGMGLAMDVCMHACMCQ
jgi:hypothetical protein